jgi:hypothetical protein
MYATAGGIAWNTNMTRTKAVGMGATARGSEFGTVNITAGQYYGVDGQIQTVPVSIGNALSPTISRSGVHTWGKLSTLADIPANSSILFDVEKTDGTKLLTDLSNGADLSSLPLYDIKIRAKFSRTDTAVQPILKSLMLDWIGSQNTKRMAKRIVFSTSSASYATALSVAGSGRLVGLITSGAGSYTPYVKATLDGVLISWAKGPTSGGAMPVAQWSSMTDGMSTAYSSTGENTNCQFGFNNSLLIEVAAASGTVSVTVFYEIDE